ncbi:MAG: hypothetical protein J6A23_08495, partial [Thermoguttaceae bacterium]|nr:hypothetical protein [Thermoguttaceae bacterium]
FGTEEDANAENWRELTLEQEENGLPKVWEDAETGEKYCLKANGERVPYSDGMTGVYRMETTEVQAYDVEETEIAAADGTVNVQIAPEARIHANAAADADGTFLGDGGTIEISADHRITVSGTTAEGIFEAHGIRNGTVTLSGEIADLNGRIVTDSQFRVLADSISWDGGADGLFYFTQGGTAGNSQLEDLTVSGADISLDSEGTITLKNVHISTRAVQENASYASAQERWTLHQTANSTGNSGSVNIKAGALVLENSEILTSARNTEGTAFSAGDVTVTLRDKEGSLTIGGKSYKTGMRLTNSAIDAGNWTVDASGKASLSSGGGKVRVSISDNSFTNLFDFGGRASAGFLLDENSAIFAGEMDLNVSAASGAYLDVSGESAETVENYGLTLFRHLTNLLSFADSGRVNEADALILLDGRIQLSGDLDAESYAAANASFTTRGVNLGFAFVKNRASSDFTIGSSAEILAQNIDLESRMNTSVYAGWSADFLGFSTTVRAIPLDVGVAVTVVETENTLTVENGAVLEAAERLALTASTENDVTGDVSVRAFEDFLGVGFVFSDVCTKNELRIGDSTETGSETELAILSGKDVELTAFTDLSTNVGSYAQVGGTTNIDVMKLANRLSKNRLDQLTGKIDAFIKRNLSFLNSLDTTKFGLTMGAAIQNTSLENQLTVGSAARISARDSLGLNSESHYLSH